MSREYPACARPPCPARGGNTAKAAIADLPQFVQFETVSRSCMLPSWLLHDIQISKLGRNCGDFWVYVKAFLSDKLLECIILFHHPAWVVQLINVSLRYHPWLMTISILIG